MSLTLENIQNRSLKVEGSVFKDFKTPIRLMFDWGFLIQEV